LEKHRNRYLVLRSSAAVLKLAFGVGFLVAVPMIAGIWMLGTPNQTLGLVTMFMGILFGVFLVGALISGGSPAGGGWTQPAVD
jgi:hypothetical protein